MKALTPIKVRQSFKAITDSVSAGYKSSKLCGPISYEILDEYSEPAPSFVGVELSPSQDEFDIIVDARNLEEPFT